MKCVVIGDGAWGTALAIDLLQNYHDVTLWGAFPDYLEQMAAKKENFRFLPGVALPDELKFSGDMADALKDAELAVLATPTQYLAPVLEKAAAVDFNAGLLVVNVAKGIENGSLRRISDLVADILGDRVRYVVLSGPSHAEEVARKVPTLVTAASRDNRFRVYTSGDVVGVELGGALKNVFAVAAGVIDGMKLGDNPKAALMARGISELGRLGESLGGKRETLAGLAGIGDLIVTCTSGHSRNRHVGEELGRGRKLADILKDMGMVVAEGVYTAKSAKELADRTGVETPLLDAVYAVLYEDRPVPEILNDLMTRAPKAEF